MNEWIKTFCWSWKLESPLSVDEWPIIFSKADLVMNYNMGPLHRTTRGQLATAAHCSSGEMQTWLTPRLWVSLVSEPGSWCTHRVCFSTWEEKVKQLITVKLHGENLHLFLVIDLGQSFLLLWASFSMHLSGATYMQPYVASWQGYALGTA
jgi:hypothetical protein